MSPTRKRSRVSNAAVPESEAKDEDGPPQKKQQQRRSLFAHSLAPSTTTEHLISHFSQSLPIKHATAVTDPTTKSCKGYGFITFADAEDAERALQEYNGSLLQGRKIKLEIAEPRHREIDDTLPSEIAGDVKSKSMPSVAAAQAKAKREQERKDASKPPKLIVRNLPWSIKKSEDLALLFRSYGKVKFATLPPTEKPGLMPGFGFVVLRGRKNAEKALEGINGKEIDGRTLAVDWAVEKDVWEQQHKTDASTNEVDPVGDSSPRDLHDDSEADEDEEEASIDEEELDDQLDDRVDEERPTQDFSSTLFIRNLPFQSSDDSLNEHFAQFGGIRYARIVIDQSTEKPKGTGFVCFFKPEDATQCLRNAPGSVKQSNPSPKTQSLLQSELDDPSGKYTMDGRVLQISKAVDRNEAARLAEEGISHRGEREKDKRRLYLLSEGTISTKSPLYQTLSGAEVGMREASLKQRKTLIQSNPSLNLSLTRLSIRNVPRSVNSKDLKALAREAVVGFAKDVKEGKRERLSKEELARGGESMSEADKLRKQRGVGIVKQAKIVFEGREGGKVTEDSGAGRSRGYGFVEYHSHRSALMGLRWLNGHTLEYKVREVEKGNMDREEVKDRKKRLIVEFAIENAQVVKRRNEKEHRSREKPQPGKRANVEDDHKNGEDSLFDIVPTPKNNQQTKNNRKQADIKAGDKSGETKSNEGDAKAKQQRMITQKRAKKRERRKAGKA